MPINPEALQQAYLEACEAELLAFKPGNVSIHSTGNYLSVEDFRESAKASTPPLCDPVLSLGERIFRAIAATQDAGSVPGVAAVLQRTLYGYTTGEAPSVMYPATR